MQPFPENSETLHSLYFTCNLFSYPPMPLRMKTRARAPPDSHRWCCRPGSTVHIQLGQCNAEVCACPCAFIPIFPCEERACLRQKDSRVWDPAAPGGSCPEQRHRLGAKCWEAKRTLSSYNHNGKEGFVQIQRNPPNNPGGMPRFQVSF